ncbi:DUF1501 domain-containing protein [Planctomicrobium sp. SH668]|uniref:DUF1501 domain-containing protein n=1 Tax=Planctomicrobium sp. SH668 TaxID=3448126 RepID=UPI003F5C5E14
MPRSSTSRCAGPSCSSALHRRQFMQLGLAGFGSLSWPGLMKLRADNSIKPKEERTAVIMVWLPGGLSHLDSYDPKPELGSEYRGPFSVIDTNVPGMQITELLPMHAKIADKYTILRSMYHSSGGHPAGSMTMLSGDPDTRDKDRPKYPDWMTVAHYVRSREASNRSNPLPNYVGVSPPPDYTGPAYVGNAYLPFVVGGNPNAADFNVPNVGLSDVAEASRLGDRVALRQSLDLMHRDFDRQMELQALDEFEAQAMTLLTDPRTKEAFDLTKEDPATRDRYGRNQWGQQLLLTRRLVEAGVEIVTSSLHGELCGRVGNWDDHAVNHHVFNGLRFRSVAYDQAVTALIEDIYERGLDKRVLVCVTGEFGRTPKIEFDRSTGEGNASAPTGVIQPGRDHWPRAFSNIWAGGGIRTGQVIGATDRRGEDVIERGCKQGDFLATIYSHLGIDYSSIMINDFNGRPTSIVEDGKAIPELARVYG